MSEKSNTKTIRVLFKILANPDVRVPTSLRRMRELFEPRGIKVVDGPIETFSIPHLEDIDVGDCVTGVTTPEQRELFKLRNHAGSKDIVIYCVRMTNPPSNGCAAHPHGKPGAVVAKGASEWTVAHEVAHVLGLTHVEDRNMLMFRSTEMITNKPPDLTANEIKRMKKSRLAR